MVRSANSIQFDAYSMEGMLLVAFAIGNESPEIRRFPSIDDPSLPMSVSWYWHWPLAYQRFAYDEEDFNEPTYPVPYEPWE